MPMKNRLSRIGLAAVVLIVALAGHIPARADAAGDLKQLLQDYDDAGLKLYPSEAMQRGDRRYLDRYEEDLTAAHLAERRQLNTQGRTRLAAIDRKQLSEQDQLSYDIFAWTLADDTEALAPGVAERFQLLPLNQFYGAHLSFAREMQWHSEYPFTTPEDYDHAIARMGGFARWINAAIVKMREGVTKGITQPRIVVERMIPQVEALANANPGDNDFLGPVKNMPASIKDADRARLASAYTRAVDDTVIPAYRRLADFLKNEYLSRARASAGMSALPGGKDMYLTLVHNNTTEKLTPEAIHALGLKEIDRITAEMETAKKEAGFTGSLADFDKFLRADPRFKFRDQAAMLAEFVRVKGVVLAHADTLFPHLPKAPLEFRFFEPYVAPSKAAAEYDPLSGDGSRPGTVSINAYDLPSRPTYTAEALELHEGLPGHHLQLGLQYENKELPAFRRFGGETAFVEGWGLYAESLGPQLGLYTDPYRKFGALSFDAWRAGRLVVDTGIHWLGWTREQGIQYLLAHTALTETDATAEVERYIAIPGQALAYKIGQLEFLSLRARAQKALGAKFDIRRFHDAVLRDGAMPMPILDAKIDRWIAAEKTR